MMIDSNKTKLAEPQPCAANYAELQAISAQHVSLALGASPILRNVSFEIPQGQMVALMGANGSGKSTLVRTLLGVYSPDAGNISIYGSGAGKPVPYEKIGYVPQRTAPNSGVPSTALEVVRSGLLSRGRLFADRGRKAKHAAMAALAGVGLAERAQDHVQIFSGGQAQRLAIARALVREPKLLILDEPLAGVDAVSREAVVRILAQLHREGVTQLIVLHDLAEMDTLIDRVIYIEAGEIAYDGPPATLPSAARSSSDHYHHLYAQHHAPRLTGN